MHRVMEANDAEPVDIFGSSGGAVNALALAEAHPDDVRRVVAHEPPTAALPADREAALAVCRDMRATYDAHGSGRAMAKFISFVMYDGLVPDDYLDQSAPDPAQFWMSSEDDGNRTDPLMRDVPDSNTFDPDVEALSALGDPNRGGGRRRVGTAAGHPWRTVHGGGARPAGHRVPQQPRWLPRRRVRPAGRPRCLRSCAARLARLTCPTDLLGLP